MRGCWQIEDCFGARGELGVDDGVGVAKLLAPLGVAEGLPVLGGDPVVAGGVGSGVEAVSFEEFGVALGAGGEGEEADDVIGGSGVVQVDEGEHLSADGFVADPEDDVVAPLSGFDGVGEGEEEGAEAFGIHGVKVTRCWVRGTGL